MPMLARQRRARAGAGVRAGQRAAHVAELQHRDGRAAPGLRARRGDQLVDRRGRQLVEQRVVLWNGSGSSGSMARSPSTTGGTIANVSRSRAEVAQRRQQRRGPRPRCRGSAAITTANERPRANAGTSGIGGKCITDAHDMSSSGSDGSSARSRCAAPRPSARTGRTARPRRARRPRRRRTRSRSRRRSCRRRRAAPRTARARARRPSRTSSPSAVTSSSAVTALVCRPCLRASQPMPPPSE